MINLSIADEYSTLVDEHLIEKTAMHALRNDGKDDGTELTIVIDSDEAVHELNKTYLGIDAPTDVLSFSADVIDPDTNRLYLGDIIISYPRVEAQAGEARISITAELQLLIIHGVLHLLGYDHADDSQKQAMWNAQASILAELGVRIDRLPE